ncbi:MAG: hypothetical protein IKU99_02685, partial [Clostridia bacterium]|nr:hypothetical protein [Clostridia bacterium]
MSKRLICLLTAIILILSMTSCSLIEGFMKPSVKPEETPDGGTSDVIPEEKPDVEKPDEEKPEDEKPEDPKPDPNPDDGKEEPEPPKEETKPTIYL